MLRGGVLSLFLIGSSKILTLILAEEMACQAGILAPV